MKESLVDYNKKYRKKAGESFHAFFLFEFVEVLLIKVRLGLIHLAALDHMAAITLKKIEVDDEIIAVVRSVSPSLVRADIGGIEVKIPLEEIRYGWIDDLTEEVKQGDHLKVKV